MQECNTSFVDASPDYLHSYDAADNLLAAYGSQGLRSKRLVVLLRNPVEREFSWYNHLVKNCVPKLRAYMKKPAHKKKELRGGKAIWAACKTSRHCRSLCRDDHDAARTMTAKNPLAGLFSFEAYTMEASMHRSHYAENLRRWLKVFDRKQVLVVSSFVVQCFPSLLFFLCFLSSALVIIIFSLPCVSALCFF